MADKTKIQWADSTCNPVMACCGCPLYPTAATLRRALTQALAQQGVAAGNAVQLAREQVDGLPPSAVYHARKIIAEDLGEATGHNSKKERQSLERAIAGTFSCYAGVLHLRHGQDPLKPDKHTNKGYAPTFEEVTCFAGRMAEMAHKPDLTDTARPEKPWLDGLPRLAFVSDMGDALSASVPFGYLKAEIVDVAQSTEGQRHRWLWLTKRPARMAKFAKWLMAEHGGDWPANLVAMTSVIDQRMAKAVDHLHEVPAAVRGLSVEPLLEPVAIDLKGIDWLIVGGESGAYARPFDLRWARDLRDQCREAGVAFFCKQLGRRPVEGGTPLTLADPHGGDWSEWPSDLKIRQMPAALAPAPGDRRKLLLQPAVGHSQLAGGPNGR